MSVVVFCGPTIDAAAVRRVLPGAVCRGPAARGDIYLTCKLRPTAIALIDGYFDQQLSVWHKEILWALSAGVRVYGAASMGALRAAELDTYGMVGVGQVYEAFARGELEDDDEVAVLHAPEAHGYEPQSDAMVNIRFSLRAALAEGIIDTQDQALLITAAKARYYPERSLASIVEHWDNEGKRARLAAWLATHGMVDQKLADAEGLLEVLSEYSTGPVFARRRREFQVANTHYWQLLRQTLDARSASARGEQASHRATGVREALPPPASRAGEIERAAAAERALALALAAMAGARVSAAEAQQASEQFRREQGLLTPEATAQWLSEHGMDLPAFSQLVHDRVLIERFATTAAAATEGQLPGVLRARVSPERSPQAVPSRGF